MGGLGGEALLGAEGSLQPVEHGVEGIGQLLQLIVWTVEADSLIKCCRGRRLGMGRDPLDRVQHLAGQQPAQGKRAERRDSQRNQRLPPELAQREAGAPRARAPASRSAGFDWLIMLPLDARCRLQRVRGQLAPDQAVGHGDQKQAGGHEEHAVERASA